MSNWKIDIIPAAVGEPNAYTKILVKHLPTDLNREWLVTPEATPAEIEAGTIEAQAHIVATKAYQAWLKEDRKKVEAIKPLLEWENLDSRSGLFTTFLAGQYFQAREVEGKRKQGEMEPPVHWMLYHPNGNPYSVQHFPTLRSLEQCLLDKEAPRIRAWLDSVQWIGRLLDKLGL